MVTKAFYFPALSKESIAEKEQQMMLVVVFLILATLGSVIPSKTEQSIVEYYVKPKSTSACPQAQGGKCDTLQDYATNATAFKGVEAFSLVFLDGVHDLQGEFNISDKAAVSMHMDNDSGINFLNPQVVINCVNEQCAISLSNIGNIELREICFRHAVVNDYKNVGKHTLNATDSLEIDKVIFESANVEVHFEEDTDLFISGTVFNGSDLSIECDSTNPQDNRERPVHAIGDTVFKNAPNTAVYYKSNMKQVVLNLNNVTVTHDPNSIVQLKGPGDVTVLLMNTVARLLLEFTQCNISQSPGYGIYVETPKTGEGYQLRFNSVRISGHNDGGLAIINYSPDSQNKEFSTPMFRKEMRGKETTMRELLKRAALKQKTMRTGNPYTSIDIANCEFSKNEAQYTNNSWAHAYRNIHVPHSGLASSLIITDYGAQSDISIENTHFHDNKDFRLEPATMLLYNTQNIKIRECTFSNNIGSPILAYNAINIGIYDSNFTGNIGSAIQAYLSEITLSGNITFTNNSAYRGGALLLYLCYLNIQRDTHVLFHNNSATTVGGAIVVEQHIFSQTPRCFYQIDSTCTDDGTECNILLEFKNNRAHKVGNSLYGASLKSDCYVNERSQTESYKVWPDYFEFELTKACNVTSDPTRVCFCDVNTEYTSCTEMNRNVTIYPGQRFSVPVAVVGDDFGVTTGSVYAKFEDMGTRLIQLETAQWTDHSNCSELYYTVSSNETCGQKTLVLRAEANKHHNMNPNIETDINEFQNKSHITDELLSTPIHVYVYLTNCPLGFKLNSTTGTCDCDKHLCDKVEECDTQTGTITRSGSTWVGYDEEKNEVITNDDCPYKYCNETSTRININDSTMVDTQCVSRLNRSGKLCGKCKEGNSLMIGSSRCSKNCTHNYIALIIVFLAGGIILVIFLKVLDLTVARGTLNGLILYANILWTNQGTIFPDDSVYLRYFLKPFIAWLNLDFGIESCFFEGLNDYHKAWLQFLFPLYIWAIVGAIIIAAQRSNFVAERLGRNSVQLLATLVYLSYAKLLRTIIVAVDWRNLKYSDGSVDKVWAADGNIGYFDSQHAPLLIVTVITLVIFWTPYTLVLFFHQWLKTIATPNRLRWIIKWKAFFEAYFGPLKDKHNYWVGLLLLVRCFLLVIFAVTHPTVNLLAMVLTMTLLLVYVAHMGGSMYKNQYLSLLENSFILNLIIVGAGMLYVKTKELETDHGKDILYVSVTVAFLQFVGIVIYHIKTEVQRYRGQHEEGGNAQALNQERDDMDVSMPRRERYGPESEN